MTIPYADMELHPEEEAPSDPWQWLHDNGFSWDDVNAIAAILDERGFDITRPQPDSPTYRRLTYALLGALVIVVAWLVWPR